MLEAYARQMPKQLVHAFVDESGQRSRSPKSSDHFVMSAVLVRDEDLHRVPGLLAQLRTDLGRNPGDTLHWRALKSHSLKLHSAQTIGATNYLGLCSVVLCKRHLSRTSMNDDQTYLYTLRLLLERLSWVARDFSPSRELHYTLAHIVRFKLVTLRRYEALLRQDSDCRIDWSHVDPAGGKLDQPKTLEALQLADAVASGTAEAFETDRFGNTEERYLREFAPRFYRRGTGANKLTSYGLKLHPYNDNTKAAYPWVAAL